MNSATDAIEFGMLDYLARAAVGVMIIEWAERIAAVLRTTF
jgi:tRNA A37 threonylcarbamoyladenosine biosynthesis protein TsaE